MALCLLLVALLSPSVSSDASLPPPRQRAEALLHKLNTTERLALLSGVWGLGYAPPAQQAVHGYVGTVAGSARADLPWLSLQDGLQVTLRSLLLRLLALLLRLLALTSRRPLKGFRDGKYGKGGYGMGDHLGSSTQWPSGFTVGATWDAAAAGTWGAAIGEEFRAKGADRSVGRRLWRGLRATCVASGCASVEIDRSLRAGSIR